MAFSGKVLYPAKHNQREHHEAHRKDIMVDGACPKKSVSPSERMFGGATHRAGKAVGVDSGDRPGRTACAQNRHPVSVSRSQASRPAGVSPRVCGQGTLSGSSQESVQNNHINLLKFNVISIGCIQ